MENKVTPEVIGLLKVIAKNNNVSWENARFFFNMGFYEGRIAALKEAIFDNFPAK